jgi:hypothetical protein
LPEGFGLVVDDVLPDSPAKTAGVQRYDILKLLNDQQLAEPNQLAALVRGLGKDAEATLTVIRKGQEQKLTVKVGEKMLPESQPREGRGFGGFSPFGGMGPGHFDILRDRDTAPGMRSAPDRFRTWRERMRSYQDEMRGYQDRLREWQKNPSGELPKAPELPAFPSADLGPDGGDQAPGPRGEGVRPADLLRELRPGSSGDLRAEWREGSSHWDASRARMVMKDRDGSVEVTVRDGHRVLTAKAPNGNEVFNGPVDTPEQRQAVPEPFRGKLEALEIRQREPARDRGERRERQERQERTERRDSGSGPDRSVGPGENSQPFQ